MGDQKSGSVAKYFGAQLAKERKKAKLSMLALSEITGINNAHLGRIERGERNPTTHVARKLDEAFYPDTDETPFTELYEASRSWISAPLRNWTEYERAARYLWVWSPGIIDGLLQTEDYARAFLRTHPGATEESITARLAGRMARQQHALYRDDAPEVTFLVDLVALWRGVGSPEIMADQLDHVLEVASLPNVTMQLVPPVAHPGTGSELIIADGTAAYVEHLASGAVYTEVSMVTHLARIFASVRNECGGTAAQTRRVIKRAGAKWRTGGSRASQVRMGRA